MKKQSRVLSQSLHSALFGFLSFLFLTLILALFATLAHCAEVTLAWDANTEPDLAGYKIYYGTSSGDYSPAVQDYADQGSSPVTVPIGDLGDPNNPEYTLTDLTDGVTYFFCVTAYDTEALESSYSNEVNTEGTLTVTSITSTTDDGYYKAGDTVNITINFSQAVTLAGDNLIVTLETGGTAVIGPFDSQTITSGTYTVQAGDNSTDLNVESLELSGGATLQNSESLDCDLSLPQGSNLADNKDIIIDTVAPSSSATAPSSGNGALSITWTASDATSGVDSTQLWYKKAGGTWSNTGLDAKTGTSGSFSYTPTQGDGTYYFATRSTDNAGNVEAGPSGDGDDSTIYDTVAPSSSATSPAYGNGALSITWTASDPTSGVDSTQLWYKKAGGTWSNTGLAAQAGTSGTFSYTPPDGDGTYYFATRSTDNAGNREAEPSGNGDDSTVYDTIPPGAPVITTDGGNGPGNDYTSTDSSITLNGTCAADTVAIYVNGSTNGVAHTPGETSWSYTGTLDSGENIFTITAEDAAGNVTDAGSITVTYGAPVGGYSDENVIPAAQINQSTIGDGIITIHFKIKDTTSDPCTLHTFEYSVNGGDTWNVPTDGDSSQCLSSGWQDNDGDHYSSAADFDGAEEHSFTFTTKHGDVTDLNGTEQSDVRVRFTVSDGSCNSLSPVTSENFLVDNLGPTVEISYSEPGPYADADTITVTATFTDANWIADTPQIAIDYAGTGSDIPLTNMTATTDNKVWTYDVDIPSRNDGTATITITGMDAAGNPVGAHTGNTLTVGNGPPTIENYPNIDHDNNTIDITFSETDMQNVTDEASYRFSPSLNFATPLVDGDDITNPSGSTYRLTMASIPAYTILTLTVSNITDAAGNPVIPSSITINDNDGDDVADDWETDNGVDDLDEDPDGDGLNNLEEYNNNTNPNNSDTDGDSLPDDWEVAYGLDPNDSTGVNGSNGDFDDDGWTNYEEWLNGTDPVDDTSFPALSPPDIIETLPHDGAGISDDTRVPNITSFCIRIEDSDGIDITDTESITFTIHDGVNETYTRDLGDTKLVRVVKLTEDEDTQVTRLWVVYDRFMEDEFGNYDYDTQINIKVDAKDTRGGPIDPAPSYNFKIESETQHDYAQDPDNLPDTGEVASDDPDLEDPEYSYNAGVQVNSGDLEGAKIVYDSDEPLTPRFGPGDEIPSFDLEGEGGEAVPMNLQPPTVFNTPVKIFIPYPGYTDVSGLSIFVYKATSWVLASDSSGNVQPGGDGWMVPGSRVNHNNGSPSTIEIKVYHFSAVQAGIPTSGDVPTPATDGADTDTATASSVEAGGGCFIATATFGPNMDWHIEILSLFRDVYLLPTKLGHVFVDICYRYSPRPGLQ